MSAKQCGNGFVLKEDFVNGCPKTLSFETVMDVRSGAINFDLSCRLNIFRLKFSCFEFECI